MLIIVNFTCKPLQIQSFAGLAKILLILSLLWPWNKYNYCKTLNIKMAEATKCLLWPILKIKLFVRIE